MCPRGQRRGQGGRMAEGQRGSGRGAVQQCGSAAGRQGGRAAGRQGGRAAGWQRVQGRRTSGASLSSDVSPRRSKGWVKRSRSLSRCSQGLPSTWVRATARATARARVRVAEHCASEEGRVRRAAGRRVGSGGGAAFTPAKAMVRRGGTRRGGRDAVRCGAVRCGGARRSGTAARPLPSSRSWYRCG
jgi:hypothetical protein